jgi:hypothetical protein
MVSKHPQVFLSDGLRLVALRTAILRGSEFFQPAVERLDGEAWAAMEAGPWSVVDKKKPAPSGDPHDFVALAGYWWPNPDTEDGLPYVPRDGVPNPESHDYDGPSMRAMASAVATLSLRAYLGDSAAHGERAATALKRWFVDSETRMNPHLEFGSYTPGVWDGSGWGIVGSHCLVDLLEGVGLLRASGYLPAGIDGEVLAWIERPWPSIWERRRLPAALPRPLLTVGSASNSNTTGSNHGR